MSEDVRRSFSTIDGFFHEANQKLGSIKISGLIKELEGENQTFLWSPINCDAWIEIEKSAVLRIVELGRIKCSGPEKAHEHHLVELTLNPGGCKNEGALKIAHGLIQRSVRALEAAPSGSTEGKIRPQYQGPCGAAWVCQDQTYIHCNPNARPYEDNTGRCECIPC